MLKKAQFAISMAQYAPSGALKSIPQIALAGKSNVGKSSLINRLANHSKLAKTSSEPGKTRLINFYLMEDAFYLVDLPGYGYAKVSKKEQETWQKNLEEYLIKRPLTSTIQFIDARHDIQKNDILMQEWLKFNNIPCFNILTKCDYISRNELNKKLAQIEKQFQNKALAFFFF